MELSKEDYIKRIDALMDIFYEDRLVIYTILAILTGYVQNIVFSQEEKDAHIIMINQMFIDYEINKPEDIAKGINNCMINIQAAKMRHTIGSVQ